MPIHDWSRVDVGLFHDFLHGWIVRLSSALNRQLPPDEHYALITPAVSLKEYHAVRRSESLAAAYRRRKNTIAIHQIPGDRVVALIDIVSPADKNSPAAVRSLVRKARGLLDAGVHLLLVDLFPSTTRDPRGRRTDLWQLIASQSVDPPADKPLALAAFVAGSRRPPRVEAAAVGDELPSMPVFLTKTQSVSAPLESTYQAAWDVLPEPIRELVEPPAD